jgi:Putative ParB-like nuclease
LLSPLFTSLLWRGIYIATSNQKREISAYARSPTFIPHRSRSEWQKFGSRQRSSKANFSGDLNLTSLNYLRRHNKVEPVTIGPQGILYITDHHHLARALFDIGVSNTYCTIIDNLSHTKSDDFWKQLEANNEVYLKDRNARSSCLCQGSEQQSIPQPGWRGSGVLRIREG